MSNSDGKLSVGDVWRPPPTAIWNAMVDGAVDWLRARGVGGAVNAPRMDPNRMRVKNNSASTVLAGYALEIGDKLLTTIDKRQLWFAADTPAPNGSKLWGVAEFPIAASGFGDLIICGAAVCRVTINDADHRYADVVNSSTTLGTAWHGMPILYKPSGTGANDLVLMLGSPHYGPFNAVITQSGGIAGGSSGTADVKWNGSTVDSITVYNDWMDGGETAGQNAEAQFIWQPDRQKYVLTGADCT